MKSPRRPIHRGAKGNPGRREDWDLQFSTNPTSVKSNEAFRWTSHQLIRGKKGASSVTVIQFQGASPRSCLPLESEAGELPFL